MEIQLQPTPRDSISLEVPCALEFHAGHTYILLTYPRRLSANCFSADEIPGRMKFKETILRRCGLLREHYRLMLAPEDALLSRGIVPPELRYKWEAADQRAVVVAKRFSDFESTINDADVSGVYSATASFLASKYLGLGCDIEKFVVLYYPLIWLHLFCPADRMDEQFMYPPSAVHISQRLNFRSTLSQITYDLRALLLHSQGLFLGRKKYFHRFIFPFIAELFKGFEFLARLYGVSISHQGSGRRFRTLLTACSGLTNEEQIALWQFRCGVVHSGVLYNKEGINTWRFGCGTLLGEEFIIRDDTSSDSRELEGRHYFINLFGLLILFERAKEFVKKDMRENAQNYVGREEFMPWVQRYWTLQYLLTAVEFEQSIQAAKASAKDWDLSLPPGFTRAHVGIVKVDLPVWELWSLQWPAFKSDFLSRFRDGIARI